MSSGEMTLVARTRSKVCGSSKMMSSVTSNGPAFLLRQTWASCLIFGTESVSFYGCLNGGVLDGEHLVRVVRRHDVEDVEAVTRLGNDVRGRERERHVAFAAHAPRE